MAEYGRDPESEHRYDFITANDFGWVYGFDAQDVIQAMDALYDQMYEDRAEKGIHGVTEEDMEQYMIKNAWFFKIHDPLKNPEDQLDTPAGIAEYYYNNVLTQS